MKITEVEGIPQEVLKGKSLPLYKAFVFSKPGKEMVVNENADMMALTPEAAVYQLLREIPLEVFENVMNNVLTDMMCWDSTYGNLDEDDKEYLYNNMSIEYKDKTLYKIEMKDVVVNFAIFKMDLNDLKKKDLVDGGSDYFENGVIGITLKDKLYKLDVEEKQLLSFKLQVNLENESRLISNIKLKDINKK
jgi:hypothetical protein